MFQVKEVDHINAKNSSRDLFLNFGELQYFFNGVSGNPAADVLPKQRNHIISFGIIN